MFLFTGPTDSNSAMNEYSESDNVSVSVNAESDNVNVSMNVTETSQIGTDTSQYNTASAETSQYGCSSTDTVTPTLPEKEDPSILIAKLLEEMQQLRKENPPPITRAGEKDRSELESEKNSLTAEIEELTKTLFEEANGMVAVEAQARWTLEQSQNDWRTSWQRLSELLDLESEQTRLLRGIVEEEKALKKSNDPVFWDIDVLPLE